MDLESIKDRKKTAMKCPRCGGLGWYVISSRLGLTNVCESCEGTGIAYTL
ncbi:hypothetical protein KAU33_08850 [Candidatus Dependentiae bacterium]|nr:hypothetical protein [Candidatus Dependentiae bacterium]